MTALSSLPPEPRTTSSAADDASHVRDVSEVLATLGTSPAGLAADKAERRFDQHGPNELIDRGGKSPFAILWEQLTAVMVLILLAAAALSLALSKFLEAGSIFAIVLLFALLGFFQEYRAEKAIAALKRLAVPVVRVRRGGDMIEVDARRLVPGDIVLLEAGSVVPADLRLVESANLRIQEAALTGESEPVEKHTDALSGSDIALGDRLNMAYLGTQVSYGRGAGVVVGTGMGTQLGRIAHLLQEVSSGLTPLQQRLDAVGKRLAVAGVAVALLLIAIGLAAGESLSQVLLTAISVAVAVIPEGLPAVVTFTLAVGAQRMLRRHALIRKLPAVEALGSVTIICTDKTGTPTENRMAVTVLALPGYQIDLRDSADTRALDQDARLLLLGGALCNDAELRDGEHGPVFIGDPTEGALLVAARRGAFSHDDLRKALPRVGEVPFDSVRKRMTTVHGSEAVNASVALPPMLADGAPCVAFVKGAVDSLLDLSTSAWMEGRRVPMDASLRSELHGRNDALAGDGMRVLGLAARPIQEAQASVDTEHDLTFIGLFGMIDPPRAEVKAAVASCVAAGIRPVMITGDHPLTAAAIARDLGIARTGHAVTGHELNEMTEAELDRAVMAHSVFARVSPEHKLRIVESLQRQGEVVAMTGDGVNDAPALKRADIGVAMGITGTDVSKEASDMVLRDDNFATIVAAVEEGRVIYDNLRRFVGFAVAGNIGKVIVMLLWPALFLATGLDIGGDAASALLPLQLLWLNLMTDGILGVSMGAEPAERGVMNRPPHSPSSSIFSGGLGVRTAWLGVLIGGTALGVGYAYYRMEEPQWQTMMFTTLAFLQVFQALGVRSSTDSLFRMHPLGNPVLVGTVSFVVAMQLAVLYVPSLADDLLQLEPLGPVDLAACVGFGSLTLVAVELEKLWLRRRARRAM